MVIYGKDGKPRLSQYHADLRRWQERENRLMAFAVVLFLIALGVAAMPLEAFAWMVR